LTTPNRKWLWLVKTATKFKVRPYEGYENFLSFKEIETLIEQQGLKIIKHHGFHPWPFQIRSLQNISQIIDQKFGKSKWGEWMINQAILAHKQTG
jgi:hypothetical protein